MTHTAKYLHSKEVIKNKNRYDYRDVTAAKIFVEGYEQALNIDSVVCSDFCEDGQHEIIADTGYCVVCDKKLGCVVH